MKCGTPHLISKLPDLVSLYYFYNFVPFVKKNLNQSNASPLVP